MHTQNDTRRYPRSIQHSEFKKNLIKPGHATKIWPCTALIARSPAPLSAQCRRCSLNEHPFLGLFCSTTSWKAYWPHTFTNSVFVCLTDVNAVFDIFWTLFNDSLETESRSAEILASKSCSNTNCPGWNLPGMIFHSACLYSLFISTTELQLS